MPHNNPGWTKVLAPLAWLVSRLLEAIFHRYWDSADNIPYEDSDAARKKE